MDPANQAETVQHLPWLWLVPAIVALNAATFMIYWLDKRRAMQARWRISERTLLALALLGGTPAAFAACHWLRHKNRKQRFRSALIGIAMLQLICACLAIAALV